MGDGWRQATLEALLSRGPWEGNITGGRRFLITREQALEWYRALPDERRACRALSCSFRSDREFDRVAQMFRRAGLVVYDRDAKAWRRAGEASP